MRLLSPISAAISWESFCLVTLLERERAKWIIDGARWTVSPSAESRSNCELYYLEWRVCYELSATRPWAFLSPLAQPLSSPSLCLYNFVKPFVGKVYRKPFYILPFKEMDSLGDCPWLCCLPDNESDCEMLGVSRSLHFPWLFYFIHGCSKQVVSKIQPGNKDGCIISACHRYVPVRTEKGVMLSLVPNCMLSCLLLGKLQQF